MVVAQGVDLLDLVWREVERCRLYPAGMPCRTVRDGQGSMAAASLSSASMASRSARRILGRRSGRRLIIPSSDTSRMTVGVSPAEARYLTAELYRAPRERSPSPAAVPSRMTPIAWQ